MAEPRLRVGGIGSPEGVSLEDETGAEVLRVEGGAAGGPFLDIGGGRINAEHKSIADLVNGVDDRAALNYAFAVAASSRRPVELVSGREYVVAGSLVVPPNTRITTTGSDPAIIRPTGPFTGLTSANDVAVATTTLTAPGIPGQHTVQVASSAGLVAGQLVNLKSSALWYYDHRDSLYKGETNKIVAVEGNTIWLEQPLHDSYDVPAETVTLRAYAPAWAIIENLAVEHAPGVDAAGASFRRIQNLELIEARLANGASVGLSLVECYMGRVMKPEIRSANRPGAGYGIQDNASFGVLYENPRTANCRRGIDFSGGTPSRAATVRDILAVGGGRDMNGAPLGDDSGFGTHGPADGIRFVGGFVSNVNNGGMLRGLNCTVDGVTFRGRIGNACVYSMLGANTTVQNCVYDALVESPHPVIDQGAQQAGRARFFVTADNLDNNGFVVVKDNVALGVREQFLNLRHSSGELHGLHVSGNVARLVGAEGSTNVEAIGRTGSGIMLRDSYIGPNDIIALRGNLRPNYPLITFGNALTIRGENIPAVSATFLQQQSGDGSLSDVSVQLSITRLANKSEIVGLVEFTVSGGSVLPRLVNIPQAVRNATSVYQYIGEDRTAGLLTFTTSGTRLVISRSATSAITEFPPGTYRVPINIAYA